SDAWLVDTTPPIVIDVVDVSPDPRETAVSTVDVIFSEPIDLGTFTRHDLLLTRGGLPIALDDTVTVAYLDATTYRISGLDAFTAFTGVYELTVLAGGVDDAAGNVGTGSAADQWTNGSAQQDQMPPTSAVNPLPAVTDSPILVSWSGEDNPGGSGI